MVSAIKYVFFDFMGTCLDWHASIVTALPADLPESERSTFAIKWREIYFEENAATVRAGQPVEPFDQTMSRALDRAVSGLPSESYRRLFDQAARSKAVNAWHSQRAWPDVAPALAGLRKQGMEIFVHANGSTRLQLNLVRSAGLDFDMLFSSQLLGLYKPSPDAYRKAVELVGAARPEEVCMVAAHAYDLRGAGAVGMKTVYIYRWTDDTQEDQDVIKTEFDAYLDGMQDLAATISDLAS